MLSQKTSTYGNLDDLVELLHRVESPILWISKDKHVNTGPYFQQALERVGIEGEVYTLVPRQPYRPIDKVFYIGINLPTSEEYHNILGEELARRNLPRYDIPALVFMNAWLDKLNKLLSVLGPSQSVVEELLNKSYQRELLKQSGIEKPLIPHKTMKLNEIYKSFDDLLEEFNTSLLFLIPTDESGGNGSAIVSSKDQLLKLSNKLYLVSPFLDVRESVTSYAVVDKNGSVEFIANGKMIIGKKNGGVEYQGTVFPRPSGDHEAEIKEYVKQIGKVLAQKGFFGFYNVDWIITPNGVYFTEVNPRLSGGLEEASAYYKVLKQELFVQPHVEALYGKSLSSLSLTNNPEVYVLHLNINSEKDKRFIRGLYVTDSEKVLRRSLEFDGRMVCGLVSLPTPEKRFRGRLGKIVCAGNDAEALEKYCLSKRDEVVSKILV